MKDPMGTLNTTVSPDANVAAPPAEQQQSAPATETATAAATTAPAPSAPTNAPATTPATAPATARATAPPASAPAPAPADAQAEPPAKEERVSSALTAPLELPEKLNRTIDVRLGLWDQLLKLEQQRRNLSQERLSSAASSELARQNRELRRIPGLESLETTLDSLDRKLNPRAGDDAPPAVDPTLEHQAEEDDDLFADLDLHTDFGDELDDDEDDDAGDAAADDEAPPAEEDASEGDAPAATHEPSGPDLLLRQALLLGIQQCKVLIAREQLNEAIPIAAQALACQEPLARIARRAGVNALPVLGLAFYTAGVERRLALYRRKIDEARLRKEAEAAARKAGKGKLRSSLGKEKEAAEPEAQDPDPALIRRREAADRELKALEPLLNETFWPLYDKMAWKYVSGEIPNEGLPHVRALLRFGLVAVHPALIDEEKSAFILQSCVEDVYEWENSAEATHVAYADEYMLAIHRNQTTLSPDEDLELNGRGTPAWRSYRNRRRAVFSRLNLELYEAKKAELEGNLVNLTEDVETLSEKYGSLSPKRRQTPQAAKLKQRLLLLQSTVARLKQAVDQLGDRFIPKAREVHDDAIAKLEEAPDALPPEEITHRETEFIRRLARLTARLKTPFLQFVLRDQFEPDKSSFHHRQAVLKAIARVEYADQYIFHRVLIPNRRHNRRLTVRTAPAFILVPGCGLLGLSLSPRKFDDPGKLMLPLIGRRPDLLEDMVTGVLADFVWDCSREDAGADWITADALCSGYAAVRWSYRTRALRTQKKAGFNKKGKDRTDWRGHYALFVDSAKDAGRKLFFACYEVYEVVIKHIGLPPGIERLRRE